MRKGKKVRLITIIVVVALLLTTQYRTIYDVVMSSSFVQAMMEYSVSDNSVEENASEQDTMDGMELESKDEIQGETLEEELGEGQDETQLQGEGALTPSEDELSKQDEILNQGVEGEDLTDYGIQIQIEDKEESYKEDVSNAFWNDGFTEETVSDNELPVIEVSMNDIEELEQAGADLGTSAIPTEVDAFIAWYSQKPADDKKVHISTYQDWMNVQTISQKMDLKGYEFQIDDNNSPSATDAKLHKLNDFSGFVGIGTEEFPFRGSLTGYLATGLSIETRVPIFAYLSTESNLSNLHIRVNSGTAGLAAHVIEYPNSGSEGVTGIISLSNIRIGGSINNSKGAAGGLFGEIRNNCATPLKISVTKFNNIGVTFDVYSIVGSDGKPTTQKLTIYGVYSGAIAGIVSGNVEYEFDAVKYDLSNVYYVQGAAPVATLTNSCVDLTDMTISGANGTLFGLVRDIPATVYTPVIRIMSSDNQSDTIHIQLPFGPEPSTSGLWGYGSNGGLIGHLKKGTLDASTHEICIIGMGKKDNSDVRGALNSAYGTSGIGGMIGVLEDSVITSGSKFEVNKVFVQGMKITETYRYVKGLGGFFGLVINSSIPASVNGEDVFTITDCYVNMGSKTPCFGAAGLAGVYIDTQGINNTFSGIKFTHLAVHTQEDGNTVRPSVGSVVGLCKMGNEKSLTISDWDLKGIFVTSNKGNGAGGVIGCTMAETAADTANVKVLNGSLDTKPVSGVSNTYMVKNDTFLIWDDYKQTGGIIGVVENANCQIDNIHVIGMALRSYSHSGGVIGQIRETTNKKYISISNMVLDLVSQSCNQNYETNSVGIKGLLLGKVEGNTIVRFDGNMDFSNTKWYWADLQNDPNNYHIGKNYLGAKTGNVGIIAGTQERAVIYMDKTCTYKPYKYNASDSYQTRRLRYVDEIGNFGGAFRNITDGNSYVFEEDEVVGTITKSGDTYQLQSEADVVRLAVALNSEGAFGTKCFDAGSSDCSDAGTACYQALMESDYVLTADTYDLTDTGIVCMQRSKGLGSSAVSSSALTADVAIFSGSFSGADAGAPAEIIHNIASNRHGNQGLFTHVGTASGSNEIAKFENLKLTESIIATEMEAGNATAIVQKMSKGGLSVYASGNVLVNNCELDIDMTSQTYADATAKNYYAGLFGKYVSYAGSNLTINNVISKGAKIVRDNDHYVSQLIACVESPVTPTTLPTIEMNDITISGSVENTVAKDTCYLGGVIAAMNENKEDGSIHTSWKNDTENWQSYETERSVLTVDGLTISDFTLTNSSSAYRSSGFLGFWWLDVDATLQNVVIGEAGKPNTLQTNQRFGGLINEVTGKMVLDNISVKNTLMNNTNTKKHSAVLVAVAEKVFLTVRDYMTDETTVVNRTDTVEFDEIAGHNKQSSVYGYNDYSFSEGGGGVLSIESSTQDKSLVFDENYNSYKSRITYQKNGATIEPKDVKNDGTRYYYDINTILQNGGDLTDAIISTPDEIMRWHLLHYVKAEFRKYFATQKEMVDIDDVRRQDFTISGTIDLNGYSYYPTPLTNKVVTGDNAKIIFYGQNVIDKETDDVARYRQPYDYDKQHYMLHTGLLYKVTACNISKLTLSGTVSERKNGASGALICSDILGVAATSDEDLKAGLKYSTKSEDYTNISDIVLDNLWVATKEKKMSGAPYSLMIDKIDDGAKVNFSKIRMTNYENESPTGYKYAGRALIGVVGTESSTADEKDIEMKLNFTDIDIADLKDDVDLSNPSGLPLDLQNATNGDKVLKTASLIYCYNYYADTSSAIYIFTKADYLKGKGLTCDESDPDKAYVDLATSEGYITMGSEIDADTEYIDEAISTKIVDDMYGFSSSKYKPYIYKYREIIVNPKPGHITEGCGTYEDPYIIRTDKQLKSVYFYLKDQTEQLTNWKLNPTGDDSSFCEFRKNTQPHPEVEAKTYGVDSDFPKKEKLNQAYYMIAPNADAEGNRVIDLSGFSDYVGFGSLAEPFIGVFVGDTSGGSLPVVKLPGFVNNGKNVETFGFINFAKGCVVKDLVIELDEVVKTENDAETTYNIRVKEEGGGVIGNVCGGDNVIDHVVVKGTIKVADPEEGELRPTAQIGGYVGCVDLGCVILRNINSESLKDFRIIDQSGTSVVNQNSYMWTGGIIGRVKDGTVVYEGLSSSTASQPIVGGANAVSGFAYQNDAGLKASPNYGILNAEYLKNSGKVSVDLNLAESRLDIRPQNEGQLMLTAMALNSGAMTYWGRKEVELGFRHGYGEDARCRNGQYHTVGSVASESDADYQDAVKNDNWNGKQWADKSFFRPYVFDYYDTTSTVWDGANKVTSPCTMSDILFCFTNNPQFDDENTLSCYPYGEANLFYLQFAENKIYNMTVLEDSFRGIGGVYFENYNTFVGNVDGNNSTVHMNYISNASKNIEDMGLFNTVVLRNQTQGCYMKDLTITGKVLNMDVVSDISDTSTLSSDLFSGDSINGKTAAGLIGRLEMNNTFDPKGFTVPYNYSFENICVKQLDVETQEYASGFIGRIKSVKDDAKGDEYANANALCFTDCTVGAKDLGENPEQYGVTIKGRADVGGFVACYLESINMTFQNCEVQSTDLYAGGMHVYYTTDSNGASVEKKVYPAAGGFVGRGVGTSRTITVLGGGYEKLKVRTKGHMGGVIGETESTLLVNHSGNSETFVGEQMNFSGLGNANEISITDTNWIETTLNADGTIDESAVNYNRTGFLGCFGGIVGFVSGSGTTVKDVTLTNISGTLNYGYKNKTAMGGLIGRFYETDNKEYVIANCVVGSSNSTLSLKATANPDPGDKIMVVAGGLVGNIECSGITKITNCSVIGDGNSILQGTDSAAGMIGYANTYTKNGKMIYYDTCTVDGLRLRGYLRVAGVEGKRNYDIPNAYPWEVVSTFYNVQVTNCEGYVYNLNELNEVYNEAGDANEIASGGLVAYSRGRVNAVNCNISNVHLKGDDVYASGGVTGRTGGTFGSVRVANTSITDCTLMGACVGGIAGRVDASLGEDVTTASKINIKNNKILSYYTSEKTKYNTLHEQFAGGMYGFWKNVSYYNIMGDNVLIENNLIGMLPIKTNTILKCNYVGGIGGLINCVVKIKTVELNNNIISILDKDAILGAASSANVPIVDYLSSSDFGIWSLDGEGNKKVAADKVETVYPVLFDSKNKKLDSYQKFENQNELLPYIQTVGLMFGRMTTEGHDKMARLTDVKVSYDEEIRIYRPAIDVGTTDNSNLHGTKYRYQIVYGENKDQKSLIDETGVDHESIPNAMGMNGEYYQFGDLLGLWDYYQKETDKKYTYRLDPDSKGNYYHGTLKNVKTSIEEILSGTYYDEEEKYRSIYTNAEGDVIPMLVYDNNESLDVVINTVLNVLTNAGGNLKENNMINGNFASVTPIKMEVKDGVVSQSENGSLQPSIIATNVKNSTVDLTVNSLGYDEQTDSKNGTFTVLRVKYCWEYSSGSNAIIYNAAGDKYVTDDTCEMIVDIPIYLERVLEYQTHFTGVLGSEYYLDNLLTNGKNNLLTLKDTYTAYVEYVYNDAYDKYNSEMTKEICYKRIQAAGYETISEGTKFVLIDLTNNGHVYYYRVERDMESVPLQAFKDANDKSYQEIPISSMNEIASENMGNTLYDKHENDENKSMPSSCYATQQYIILVDSSEVVSDVENYAYQFVVQPIKSENEVLLRRSIEKKCPETCKLEITEYQGLSGSFDKNNTSIEGEISPESDVTINLDYTISAQTAYWNYLSANKGSILSQYLDVAIYLEQNGNRVALPTGTQVVFKKGEETIVGVMQGNTILYQYKDFGKEYDLNELTCNTRIQGTLELDFSSADFSGFNSGEYNVVLELLKTKDADFPMGGDVLDTFQMTVTSIAKKNLGFAIEPKDLLTLGMNGYLPEQSDRGVIDCDMRIDFSDYYNLLGSPSSEMNALKEKYFSVVFSLEKKVKDENGILSYQPYDGNLVKVYFGDSQKANLESDNGSKVVYKFTESYISSWNREEKYVVSFPYTVKVDVDGLIATYDDITNYRVVANLYLSDNKPIGTEATLAEEATNGCEIYISPNAEIPGGAEGMEDFFVFTIAKIKTDLDLTK